MIEHTVQYYTAFLYNFLNADFHSDFHSLNRDVSTKFYF